MTITWPERTRLLPKAANSIKVSVFNPIGTAPFYEEELLMTRVIPRPTVGNVSSVELRLPPVLLRIQAEAFPEANGTGTPQAKGSKEVTIKANDNTSFEIVMNTTIDRIVVTPSEIALYPGDRVPVTASAVDSEGRTVLTSPSNWRFELSPSTVLSLTSNGAQATIEATDEGTATLTVRETESGKELSLPVNASLLGPPIPTGMFSGSLWFWGTYKEHRITIARVRGGYTCDWEMWDDNSNGFISYSKMPVLFTVKNPDGSVSFNAQVQKDEHVHTTVIGTYHNGSYETAFFINHVHRGTGILR